MNLSDDIAEKQDKSKNVSYRILEYKKRMLAWNNPVEFVNNMYGCHPDGDGNQYFEEIYGRKAE